MNYAAMPRQQNILRCYVF